MASLTLSRTATQPVSNGVARLGGAVNGGVNGTEPSPMAAHAARRIQVRRAASFGDRRTNRITQSRSKQTSPETQPPPQPEPPTPLSIHFKECGHSNTVLSSLNDMRVNGELCDVQLVAENVKISAHKVVLCANSPYFRAMFASHYTESDQCSVAIHDVTSDALEALVKYFYTSQIHISTDNVQEVLTASSMLQITPIIDTCCEFMRRHLGVSNCLGVRAFADMHSCFTLKKLADNFAKRNFASLVGSEDFLKLHVEQLMELFAGDDLRVESEEKVYEAVMTWIKYDPANREKFVVDLLEKVRLPLLSPTYLCDYIAKNDIIKGNPRAMGLLMKAMECHLLPERKAGLKKEQKRPRTAATKTQVILAVGGLGRREPTGTPSIEVYNPTSRQWHSLTQMASGRWGAGLVTLETDEDSEEVYLVGGSNESSRLSIVQRYNVSTDKWTSLAEMSVARNGVGVVNAGGLLYAIGGFDGVSPLKSAEVYNPQTNKWSPLPDMQSKRFGLGACHCDGLIYAVGGSDGSNLNTAECYNIAKKTWSSISPMQFGRKFPGVESLAGRVYVIGGRDTNTSRLHSVEMFISSINQWVSVASLLSPRSGLGVVAHGGYLYAVGGHDGSVPLATVERYDPLINEWSAHAPMGVARDCVGVSVVWMAPSHQAAVSDDFSDAVVVPVTGGGIIAGGNQRTSPVNRSESPVSTI